MIPKRDDRAQVLSLAEHTFAFCDCVDAAFAREVEECGFNLGAFVCCFHGFIIPGREGQVKKKILKGGFCNPFHNQGLCLFGKIFALLRGERCTIHEFGVLDKSIAAIVRVASIRIYEDGGQGDDFVVEFHILSFFSFDALLYHAFRVRSNTKWG